MNDALHHIGTTARGTAGKTREAYWPPARAPLPGAKTGSTSSAEQPMVQ